MAEGKYALLYVPEHSAEMSSYLRIGATEDDDKRWRDFTDGNRITTTRGDKIEVIWGTYEMTVLGRHELDVDDDQAGWSVNDEGEVKETSKTYRGGKPDRKSKRVEPSTRVTMGWGPRGKKQIEEMTVKGDVDTTYHGDTIEQYYGERIESQTGAEVLTPLDLAEPDASGNTTVDVQNPVIVDKTWAESISSYTGSAALPVPSITSVTWVKKKDLETHVTSSTDRTFADSTDSTTTVTGAITSVTSARSMKDTTTVEENVESESKAKKFISTTHGDSDSSTYGDTKSYSKGNSFTEVVGMETTINYGLVNELVLGAMIDSTIGGTASLTVGGSVNVTISAEASLGLSAKFEMSAGPNVEVTPAEVKAFLDKTAVAAFDKSLALFHLLA